MEAVGAVVPGELAGDAVEGEAAVGDAVAAAADERAEIGRCLEIALQVVVAEHDVARRPRRSGTSHEVTMPP